MPICKPCLITCRYGYNHVELLIFSLQATFCTTLTNYAETNSNVDQKDWGEILTYYGETSIFKQSEFRGALRTIQTQIVTLDNLAMCTQDQPYQEMHTTHSCYHCMYMQPFNMHIQSMVLLRSRNLMLEWVIANCMHECFAYFLTWFFGE